MNLTTAYRFRTYLGERQSGMCLRLARSELCGLLFEKSIKSYKGGNMAINPTPFTCGRMAHRGKPY